MPGDLSIFNRNLNSSDTTHKDLMSAVSFPTAADIVQWGWTNPGYTPKEWNTAHDGSGITYALGSASYPTAPSYYLIWEAVVVTTYITTSTELASIADAIRLKGGTSAALTYPSGFISAINDIPTGGSTDIEDGIITRTISGAYENSRVTNVSIYAFAYCSNLTTISFPLVTTINDSAFTRCSNLTAASFPLVTTISYAAFSYCSNLTTISFPKATTIGIYAFAYCSNLTTISFPSATTISGNAFAYCSNLTTISFPSATTISGNAFTYCSRLTTISFPSATTIRSSAFAYCSSLTTASFPNVSTIGNYAFRGCIRLISLYLSGSSVVTLSGTSAFYSTPIGGYSTTAGQYGSVYVPTSLLTSYKAATYWSLISSRIVGY